MGIKSISDHGWAINIFGLGRSISIFGKAINTFILHQPFNEIGCFKTQKFSSEVKILRLNIKLLPNQDFSVPKDQLVFTWRQLGLSAIWATWTLGNLSFG